MGQHSTTNLVRLMNDIINNRVSALALKLALDLIDSRLFGIRSTHTVCLLEAVI